MSMRRASSIIMYLAVALTPGCGSAGEIALTLEAPTLEAPTRQDQPANPAATITPRGRSSGAVITFTRTGGIAGISEMWSIYADGRVLGAAGEQGSIPVSEVGQLLAEIEAAGFFDWPARPRSLESCADCFTYSLTVEYQGKTNRITLVDGESGAPEEAWAILERILGILESVSD
jgi:hypothetical protein